MSELGFPLWVRLTHWFNVLFLSAPGPQRDRRSSRRIRSSTGTTTAGRGSEWLRFTRKRMPADRLWCSTDEEVDCPAWLGLPGGPRPRPGPLLALRRGASAGSPAALIYVALLFASPQWRRLVPTSWEIIPEAWRTFVAYASFQQPEPPGAYNYDPGLPFNALQQLAYFGTDLRLDPAR